MIDWKLIGVMSALIASGLIVATVLMLGLTRAEKILGVLVFAAGCSLVVFARVIINKVDSHDFHDQTEFDRWLSSLDRLRGIAAGIWWIGVSAAALFLLVAVRHIWHERARFRKPLQSAPKSGGATL